MESLTASTAFGMLIWAGVTLLPGFSTRERLMAFTGSAAVMVWALITVCVS
jgi:membrane protein DedA with SNARE-associated domain